MANIIVTGQCTERAKPRTKRRSYTQLHKHHLFPEASKDCLQKCSQKGSLLCVLWEGSVPVIFFGAGFFLVVVLFWHKQEQSCKINIVPHRQKAVKKKKKKASLKNPESPIRQLCGTGSLSNTFLSSLSACLSNLVKLFTFRGMERKIILCTIGNDSYSEQWHHVGSC